jgi:hypothetical protein
MTVIDNNDNNETSLLLPRQHCITQQRHYAVAPVANLSGWQQAYWQATA